MAGREIKGGIVVHPILATAILGAVVSVGGLMYHNFSSELAWQHDQLVTLSVQKADADKQAQQEHQERVQEKISRESTDEAWRTNMKVELSLLKDQQKKGSN